MNSIELFTPGSDSGLDDREKQDEAIAWSRWIRSVPRPMVVDLSLEARMAANATVSDDFLRMLNLSNDDTASKISIGKMKQIRTEFLNRISCKLILLPSGQSMQGSLSEPNGSLIFGKLLYGGVTRYRILPSSNAQDGPPKPPRRAGERTERKTSMKDNIPCWVQYGGTERKYDAVDMGAAMVLEVSLAPKIQTTTDQSPSSTASNIQTSKGDMVLTRLNWSPNNMFRFVDSHDESQDASNSKTVVSVTSGASTLQGKERNDAFISDFKDRVGGLRPQIDAIVRRVLDGRVIRPAETDANGNLMSFSEAKSVNEDGFDLDNSSKLLSLAALEAQELEILGLTPVRGLLLYGPPGNGKFTPHAFLPRCFCSASDDLLSFNTGKTALAREIARALKARAPKIVSA